MRKNRMKEKIRQGKPVFGATINVPEPTLVELAGYLGFDFALLDAEHGKIDVNNVEECIRAAELMDITPVVVPVWNDRGLLLRYLDRGAQGLQVPHINTKAEAEAAVRWVKYYPQGKRGLAHARPYEWGTKGTVPQFLEDSNRETLIAIKLEEMESIKNLAEILTVEGIDIFFIGPSDLSQSMGYYGQMDHPRVKEVVDKAIDQIHAAGKASGYISTDAIVEEYVKKGVLWHQVGLVNFIVPGAKEYLRRARAAESKR